MDFMRPRWVFIVMVIVCSLWDLSTSHMLNIEPLELEVLVHQPFSITCAAVNITMPNDLRLKFIFPNGSENTIYEAYFKHPNESAVTLDHPGLSFDFDGCNILCYGLNNESAVASVSIKEKHPIPEITKYEVSNWEELHFEWQWENKSRTLDTKFKGWFKDSVAADFTECPIGMRSNECVIRKKPAEIAPSAGIVFIKVNGTNRLENISMEGLMFRINDRIRPGKVKRLKVEIVPADYSVCFAYIKAPQPESITYNISTSCQNGRFQMSWEETPVDVAMIRMEILFKLVGLPANSNCTVSIMAKPSQGGFWGPSETHSFKTLESVPLATPSMCRNCFDLQTTGKNLRDAVIYFKPLPDDLARGKVTGYKVQYADSQTRHSLVSNSSSFMHRLRNLLADDDYRVTVEAKTALGFNETLQTTVTVIERSANLQFRIDKFIVISNYQNTVSTSWVRIENASTYTLFWCEREVERRICKNVPSWIELPANYSFYDISLAAGWDSSNYIFGIGSTWNGFSSAVQWSDCTYDSQAIAEPPSIAHNYSTSDEIYFTLKKVPACGKGAGFIINYLVYFCPVSSEENQHCIAGMQLKNVDGWTEDVRLTDLASEQMYLVVAESWTAAGRSAQNATKVLATKSAVSIAVWLIVLIAFASVICVILVSIGLCSIIRFYRRSLVRYKQWLTVGITTPPGKTADMVTDEKNVSERETGSGGYATVSEREYPNTSRHKEEEQTKGNKIEEQIHIDVLPIKCRSDRVDVPLFSEERLLPPITRVSSHGSSPSIMLHTNKSISSPERLRILPTIRGKPAYVKPLRREDGIPAEAVPMVSSSENDRRNPTNDNFESESSSYAYVRQHLQPCSDFLETSLSEAAPLKFTEEEFPEDCAESVVSDSVKGDEENIKTIGIGKHLLGNATGSFEHLPPLHSEIS